jgi:hypothetical protein
MALRTRKDFYEGVDTRIDSRQLVNSSRLVTHVTGMVVQPNKAIVGANAFAHEAGIHQDGMLKNRETYEIMTPESVGWEQTRLVLGKHSGRAGFKSRIKELGYTDLSDEKLEELYHRFIDLTDRKKVVTNADLTAIVEEDLQYDPEFFTLAGLCQASRATHRHDHPIGSLRSLHQEGPGVLPRNVVGHHPVVVQVDVGFAVTEPHAKEGAFFIRDMRGENVAHLCAAAFGRLTGDEPLEEDVEGHAVSLADACEARTQLPRSACYLTASHRRLSVHTDPPLPSRGRLLSVVGPGDSEEAYAGRHECRLPGAPSARIQRLAG